MGKFAGSRKDSPKRGRKSSGRDRDNRPRRDSDRGRRDDRPRSFGRRDSGRRSFGGRSGGRDRDRPEMTEVICSECGEKCKVPFKSTSDKPVYCSDCFEKREKGSKAATASDIEEINDKLDKILALLKKK